MSRRQRILMVLVGVAIVVLYLVAMSCQARAGTGDRDTGRDGPLGWLGERFGGRADVEPAEVSADCESDVAGLAPGWLMFDRQCTLTVAAGEGGLRLVPIRAWHAIGVSAPAPVGDFTMDNEVAAGDTIRVAVGSDGAEIRLLCRSVVDCLVELGAGDG